MAEKKIPESEAPGYVVKGNDLDAYVGVSAEYMTYADDTHKPITSDDEDEQRLVKLAQKGAERAVIELNEFGQSVSKGDSPFKSAVDEDGDPIVDKDDNKDDETEADADAPAASKRAAATTAAKPATAK